MSKKNSLSKSKNFLLSLLLIFSTLSVVMLFSFYSAKGILPGLKSQKNYQLLPRFGSCNELKDKIKSTAFARNDIAFDVFNPKSVVNAEATASAKSKLPEYFTETNVQVEGIDESDILKTDGKYIYALNQIQRKIKIVQIYPVEQAKLISEINLDTEPIEMFLYKNQLVVYSNTYSSSSNYEKESDSYTNYSSFVLLSIYDVSEPKSIELTKTVEIEGNFKTSRMKDGYIYVITNKYSYNSEDPIPYFKEDDKELKKTMDCNEINILDDKNSQPYFTTILTLNLNERYKSPQFHNYYGEAETVYMSHGSLYLTSSETISSKTKAGFFAPKEDEYKTVELTTISKFDYEKHEINFVNKTGFEGHLLNQFSLDEYENNLRIVGTVGDVWNENSTNFLIIYDESLEKISTISGLANGEKIYSARFYGETGVMVTFKKVDPLFVFDLSDPERPKLKGELKIPGYSDYLHFIDENTVIGFGKDTVEANVSEIEDRGLDFAWYQGLKIAIFDISDMTNPKEVSKLILGDRGSESEALYDHRAFLFDPKHNLIIIPAEIHKIDESKCSNYSASIDSCYGEFHSQGAQVIKIKDNKLTLLNEISHVMVTDNETYLPTNLRVKRSMILEDYIITISEEKIKIHDIKGREVIREIVY